MNHLWKIGIWIGAAGIVYFVPAPTRVIDRAIPKKCMIITANKDFVECYRDHPFRKRRNKTSFFYGLIFLKPSKLIGREEQLRRALRGIAWKRPASMTTLYSWTLAGERDTPGSVIQTAQPSFLRKSSNGTDLAFLHL